MLKRIERENGIEGIKRYVEDRKRGEEEEEAGIGREKRGRKGRAGIGRERKGI